MILAAEVTSEEDRGYSVSFGCLGELVGFLPIAETDVPFRVGQTILVQLKGAPKSRLVQVTAKINSAALKESSSFGSIRVGCLVSAEVTGAGKDRVKVKFQDGQEGSIDIFQLSGDIGYKRSKDLDLSEHFQTGQKLKTRIIWSDPEEKQFILSAKESVIQLSSRQKEDEQLLEEFMGEVIEGQVLRVDPTNGLLVEVPGSNVPAYVHISRVSDEHLEKLNVPIYKVGSRHQFRIVDFDSFDGLLQACMKASTLKETISRIEDVKPGQTVKGLVAKIEPYGLLVQLTPHIRAICPVAQMTETQSPEALKKYSIGSKYRFRVLDVEPAARRITLTRKAGLVGSEISPLTSISEAKIGETFDGFIAAIKDFGLLVRFFGGVKGLIPVAEISDDYQDKPQAAYFPGQVIRARVIRCDPAKGELNLSLRKFTGPKQKPTDKADLKKKKEVEPVEPKPTEQKSTVTKRSASPSVQQEPAPKQAKTTEITLDDLVDEIEDETLDNKILLTEETKPKAKKEDSNIPSLREICDEFERRIIGQPNSSFLWIQYMSALLKASEVEEARRVAERALTTIRFRDVQEKLNVWIAMLNLENAFGTPETLKKVFDRAIVYNDSKAVHLQLIKIYEASQGKEQEALDMHKLCCKKFSQSCKVWVGHLLFLYSTSKDVSGARKLLPQALKSLPKRKHIKLTCKAAQMEYKYGSVERARTLFEGVLANAPKRVDIWSVYLTMEENRLTSFASDNQASPDDGLLEAQNFTRRLFERVVHLRMSSKKAKFFFKRFLDFEKVHGTPATAEHVKGLARAYVEANMAE